MRSDFLTNGRFRQSYSQYAHDQRLSRVYVHVERLLKKTREKSRIQRYVLNQLIASI